MSDTVVVFESGTIADSMKKAGAVAPSKVGAAFDTASGIIMDVTPGSKTPCVIRATDTEVFFMETLDVVSCAGESVRWRLPAQLLANVIGSQAAGSGKTITFTQISPSQVQIKCGTMRSKINLNLNTSYPEWDPSTGVNLINAPAFGESLKRVIWAAEKGGVPQLSGFHLTGTHAIATDRYRIARIPLEVKLDRPVTIPTGRIASLISQAGDVLVGMDGEQFVVMPDDYTEIKTVIFGGAYPPIEMVTDREYETSVSFSKDMLIERVQRAVHFAGTDRAPVLFLFLGRSQLAIMMQNPEVGQYGDVVDLPGQAEHDRITLRFTPSMILDGLSHAPSKTIEFNYNTSSTNRPVRIDGGQGYQCWLAPRSEITPAE